MREDWWLRFYTAALQGEVAASAFGRDSTELAMLCARHADAMMAYLDSTGGLHAVDMGETCARICADWTWGRVEIFGRVSHLGRYRWTPGERFLDVEDLRIDGELVERFEPHRYGAKAVFSVSPLTEQEVRELSQPYEPPPRDAWRDPPASEKPPRESDPPPSSY